MNEIVHRLMENHRLTEMAMEQSKAISHCRSLGKEFIEHYHKVYAGGLNDRDFNHHCKEMQVWYNDVKSIRLKSNNKLISKVHLIDWFFTAGAGVEDFLSESEVDSYNEFILQLLTTDKSIKEVLSDLFSSES